MRAVRLAAIASLWLALSAPHALATPNTWVTLKAGTFLSVTTAPSPAPGAPDILFAGLSTPEVLKSADGGVTWTSVLFQRASALATDPNTPGAVYAATGAGLYRSLDYGTTWTLLNPATRYFVAVNPANPALIYADTQRSTDGGATWTLMSGLGVAGGPSFHLKVSPAAPNFLLASSGYQSTDGGATWVRIIGAQRGDFYSVEIDPSDARYYYVGYCNYIQRWFPGGTQMSILSGDHFALAVDPAAHNRLYLISQNGSFRSYDFGDTWVSNAGGGNITSIPQGRLILDPRDRKLYVPAAGLKMMETGCFDVDGDGFFYEKDCGTAADCLDTNATAHPGAGELCDAVDNDCNGVIDNGYPLLTYYRDNDADGYGALYPQLQVCPLSAPTGYVANSLDCADYNASVNPDAVEVCDRQDNDCDSQVDEGFATFVFFRDYDGDGFGNANWFDTLCESAPPLGWLPDDRDCDDYSAAVNPTAPEICDTLDNNCDGTIDEGCTPHSFYPDADGDGYGVEPAEVFWSPAPPAGYAEAAGDCGDADPAVHPGAVEWINDGLDQDCDGLDRTLSISKASWSRSKASLTVEAPSSVKGADSAVLVGYGTMTWSSRKLLWSKSVTKVTTAPTTLTVSVAGGSVTSSVTTIK